MTSESEKTIELNPCPWCRGEMTIKSNYDRTQFYIRHKTERCHLNENPCPFNASNRYKSAEAAADAWNNRNGLPDAT